MTVNGTARVHWFSQGAGETIVLLHGMGGEIDFFTTEIAELSTRFQVIAIDLRGSGGTPGTGGHTMADLAGDVRAVLDDAGVARAHVLGFSMGGCVAQAFATGYPNRLDKLVLAATFAVLNPQARLFLDAVRQVYLRTGSQRMLFDLVCPWLFSVRFLADPAAAEYISFPDTEPDEPVEAWTAQYAAQREFDGRSALADIAAPTLVLCGGEDALVSRADAELLAGAIPDVRLRVLPGAGHLVNIEEPREFLATVAEFLG